MHQVTNHRVSIKVGTKAEPDPNSNANATICVLLKYNAQGTTRRVLLMFGACHVEGACSKHGECYLQLYIIDPI